MAKLKTVLHLVIKLCIVYYFFDSGYNLMNESQAKGKLFA